jgi:hypothetical protein
MLGCELAEGWMHRFKLKPKRPQLLKKDQIKEEVKAVPSRDEGIIPKISQI